MSDQPCDALKIYGAYVLKLLFLITQSYFLKQSIRHLFRSPCLGQAALPENKASANKSHWCIILHCYCTYYVYCRTYLEHMCYAGIRQKANEKAWKSYKAFRALWVPLWQKESSSIVKVRWSFFEIWISGSNHTHFISGLKSRVLKLTFFFLLKNYFFYFEIHRAPLELLLPSAKKSVGFGIVGKIWVKSPCVL